MCPPRSEAQRIEDTATPDGRPHHTARPRAPIPDNCGWFRYTGLVLALPNPLAQCQPFNIDPSRVKFKPTAQGEHSPSWPVFRPGSLEGRRKNE
jgi:hypothetical protein